MIITQTERETIRSNMIDLFNEYDYNYTLHALDKIIDKWADEKSTLIEAFKKHPNYVEGSFMIAFDSDFHRDFDTKAVYSFSRYILEVARNMWDTLPEDIEKQRAAQHCTWLPARLWDFLRDLDSYITARTISQEVASVLEEILPQIHPHAGEKASRVVNRICKYLGYDKDENYNREFAKFADGLSPLTIKRHTVLSVNPLDYLTMSFGNSWASCHTIDKHNKRGMPNSYEGQYSSGTMSYMLDGSSMVFYTVDTKYDATAYWNQPKVTRQMFHWGEDKLVQGRLYPQSNDDDASSYAPYRNIVQGIMALIFNFPNLWKVSKGYDSASQYIDSRGTHYRDYESFSNCSLSRIVGIDNERYFIVGHEPICIECGHEHGYSESINCCSGGITYCSHCGRRIRNHDDEIWVDDDVYCEECVTYCDECGCYELSDRIRWVESTERYVCDDCLESYYTYCDECECYYPDHRVRYVESNYMDVCENCLEEHYLRCPSCGRYFRADEHGVCPECDCDLE